MKDKDFENLMDSWADHEIESAPDIKPTADMYRMVSDMGQGKLAGRMLPRWVMVGTAVASLAVLIMLAWTLFSTDTKNEIPIWQVAQRPGFPAENGIIMEQPEPGEKGPSRGLVSLKLLHFQFQQSDLPVVQAVDLQAHPDKKVVLSSADNYRLLLEPAADRFLYVFQLTSSDKLVQLFPESAVSTIQNPVSVREVFYLPASPNWFYLDEMVGREQLYILASAAPLSELEKQYARYRPSAESAGQAELLSELLLLIDSFKEAPVGQVQSWTFSFNHE